jgi:hypothetical protein
MTQAWGEANRQVGGAIGRAQEESGAVGAEIAAMAAAHTAATATMVEATQAWGEGNRGVGALLQTAQGQNQESQELAAAASTRLKASHQSVVALVESWPASDHACQGAMRPPCARARPSPARCPLPTRPLSRAPPRRGRRPPSSLQTQPEISVSSSRCSMCCVCMSSLFFNMMSGQFPLFFNMMSGQFASFSVFLSQRVLGFRSAESRFSTHLDF